MGNFTDSNDVVCDQICKFFVLHVEEFMAGHEDVNGVYEKLGREFKKGSWRDQVEAGRQEGLFLFQVMGRKEPGDSQTLINEWEGQWWFELSLS
jgi:hypothetical protein